MKPRGLKLWFWLLLVGAGLILAYAASTPLWVARVSEAQVTSVDPQVVVGLAALVVAVLTLAGGAVYVLLLSQTREQVRRDIMGPVEVMQSLSASNACYLEYSKTWTDRKFVREVLNDLRFQTIVRYAINNAREALDAARGLGGNGTYESYRINSVNTLAYHLATWYLITRETGNPDEAPRLEAICLADELRPYTGNETEFQETLAWIDLACHLDKARGQKIVTGLINREGIPKA